MLAFSYPIPCSLYPFFCYWHLMLAFLSKIQYPCPLIEMTGLNHLVSALEEYENRRIEEP